MNLLKILAAGILTFACFTFAHPEPQALSLESQTSSHEPESNPADVAFSHLFVGIEGGEIYPFFSLIDAVDKTLYGGFNARYTYWDDVDGIIMFHYSYFEPVSSKVRMSGVHQFSGKVGVDWRWNAISPIIVGAGFTCDWTRADSDKKIGYDELGGTLTDNETEFGWFARINVPVIKLENYRVGLNVMWEQLWTLPKRSNMLSAGAYIERRIW